MKLAYRGSLLSPLFAVELHTALPERMVQFYEELLSVKFKVTAYPYPCHMASLGQLALIISGPKGYDGETASEPGKCTFGLLASDDNLPAGDRYFLYPKRPLGRAWPKQYASRIRDPEGNYLAFASSMEDVMGREPPITSLSELLDCFREYASVSLGRIRNRWRGRMAHAVDWYQYGTNRITVIDRDLSGYTHVVASREGLYVVNPLSYKLILRGSFFGTTVKDGAIYCFQSCGRSAESKGRILKLSLNGSRIGDVDIIAKGLDDGCHQIDFVGEDLMVVDCYNGRILQFPPGASGYTAHYPLGPISREVASKVYHINSLVGHPDGTIWLLLHNTSKKPSEVLVLSHDFKPIRRFSVRAGAAHNIVFTNDTLEYLIADSSGARVISAHGTVVDMEMMRPRGVSLDEDTCVVGDSFFCPRPFRRYVPGRVHFFERSSWSCTSSLLLPAAPTEIRRIDGRDYSLSNYFMAQAGTHVEHRSSNGIQEVGHTVYAGRVDDSSFKAGSLD